MPLKLPQALVPEIEPALIATHLAFDDPKVGGGGVLRHTLQFRQLPAHAFQEADLESDEVRVDTYPVPGVLPMGGPEVLAVESSRALLGHGGPPRQGSYQAAVATRQPAYQSLLLSSFCRITRLESGRIPCDWKP